MGLVKLTLFGLFLSLSFVLATDDIRAYPASTGAVFHFQDLLKLLKTKTIDSPESFIGSLPDEMRRKYVLIYDSRNKIQYASPDQPRILLFNQDSSMAIAFEGVPNPAHKSTAEIIHFDRQKETFNFATLSFSEGTATLDKNPKICASCHHERPIWDSYPHWPGIYGGTHTKSVAEEAMHRRFIDSSGKRGLYKYLDGLSRRPVNDNATSLGGVPLFNSNRDISHELNELNSDRLFKKMRSHPRYGQYRAALLAGFSGSDDFIKLLPGSAGHEEELRMEYTAYERKETEALRLYVSNITRRSLRHLPETPDILAREGVELSPRGTRSFFKGGFALSKMGINLQNETLILNEPVISFSYPRGWGAFSLMSRLTEDVLKDHPQFRSALKNGSASEVSYAISGVADNHSLLARLQSEACFMNTLELDLSVELPLRR